MSIERVGMGGRGTAPIFFWELSLGPSIVFEGWTRPPPSCRAPSAGSGSPAASWGTIATLQAFVLGSYVAGFEGLQP